MLFVEWFIYLANILDSGVIYMGYYAQEAISEIAK
jgi:hypothetical protein